jgi:anti-sigma regulatory factor (Ser/Thr protein kinase)
MPVDRGASTNGQGPSVKEGVSARSELDQLRVTCRRQATVIDTLGEAIAALRTGAGALKAENAGLRVTNQRMIDRRPAGPPAADDMDLTEVHLRLDAQAPAAARAIVATGLRHRLAAPTFDRVQLLASELVSNGVIHSGASDEAMLVFRLELSPSAIRLEVEDPSHRGAVAPRPHDLDGGGGFGLNLVQQLSERWGLERIATGGTRVWASIALEPLPAAAA